MYDADSIMLLYPNGMRGALTNICHGNGVNKWATVIDLHDAVESAKCPDHLVRNLAAIRLVGFSAPTIDRDTEEYTRVKSTDAMGNIHYIHVRKK